MLALNPGSFLSHRSHLSVTVEGRRKFGIKAKMLTVESKGLNWLWWIKRTHGIVRAAETLKLGFVTRSSTRIGVTGKKYNSSFTTVLFLEMSVDVKPLTFADSSLTGRA